jgi:hypothetical protein
MPDTAKYALAVERAVKWLRSMLVVPDGSLGVYERYRIDRNEVNHWVRPDCTMEVARLFYLYGQYKSDPELMETAKRMARFVISLQRPDGWLAGSFPFYRFIARVDDEIDIGGPDVREVTFPNDNGKVAERLWWFSRQSGDDTFLGPALKCCEYLMRTQAQDNAFSLTDDGDQPALKGVDFVAWPSIALIEGAVSLTSDSGRLAAVRGISWIYDHITPDGRVQTSYETADTEAWRPPSSELAVALKACAVVARYTRENAAWDGMVKLAKTLIRWQDKSGAIVNCDAAAAGASLQNDPDLTDMVYTNGYALLALQEAFFANGDSAYRTAAERLGDFLVDVQCWGESDQWDGSWRGSYSLQHKRWQGRANQGNELDEGGMYSAYTGWSTAPIAFGLLRMLPKPKK